MTTLRTIAEIRRALEAHRPHSTIGLVPTMGALHAGHVALFDAARRESDVVVATIFVNPAQFSDSADLARYPRTETQDERMAAAAGVDFVFAPSADELYPGGYATWVEVNGPAEDFEGAYRPGAPRFQFGGDGGADGASGAGEQNRAHAFRRTSARSSSSY